MEEWDPYKFQVPKEGEGVVPRAILVMLLILVGLLDFMAAGSKILIGTLLGAGDDWVLSSAVLTLIGFGYFALARGVWALSAWVPLVTALLTTLVLVFGVLRYLQEPVIDLVLSLIFLLAMGANLGLLGWLSMPETRAQLGAEAQQRDAGSQQSDAGPSEPPSAD